MKRALLLLALTSCGDDDLAWDKAQIRELSSKAAAAEDKRDFDGAIALYQQALALAEKYKDLKSQRASLRQSIEDAKKSKDAHAKAKAEFAALLEDHEKHAYPATREGILEFLHRARRVRSTLEALNLPTQRVTEVLTALDRELPNEPQDSMAFHRKQVAEAHLQKGKEDFPAARDAWKRVLEKTKNPDVKRRAPEEIENLNRLSVEAWNSLRFRAIEIEDPKKAAEFLRGHVERFRGCKLHDRNIEQEILDRIRELEK